MRFEETITRSVYNQWEWPEITGVFGVTSEIVEACH